MQKNFISILVIFCFLIGCNHQQDSKESRLALMKTTQPKPVKIVQTKMKRSISDEVKNAVLNNKQIYDAAIIEGEKKILVAYKVKHFYRFKMKSIEKKLKKQLEKEFPNRTFIVSSDYKIFLESVRLKEAMSDHTISDQEGKKRFKKIIKLTEELT